MNIPVDQMEELLAWLYGLERRGVKVGLSHTEELVAECGNPHHNYPVIHIAGTNGKGSTAAILAALLRASGKRVGLYTSPHLLRFNERVRVDGIPVPDTYIAQFVREYRPVIDRINSTFFETTTALALSYFAECGVDVAVVETGLGGRLDSTNIIRPAISVITPVSIDHTSYLGDSLADIAREKAGIIKKDIPLVLAPQDQVVADIITGRAEKLNAPVYPVPYTAPEADISTGTGTVFRWCGEDFSVGLLGKYQAQNAVTALETFQLFTSGLDHDVCRRGLSKVNWPGRMQVLRSNPTVIYDVAHNQSGIKSVLDNVNELFGLPPVGLLALKSDKDLGPIVPALRNRFRRLYVTGEPDAGLLDAVLLQNKLAEKGIFGEAIIPVAAALETILSQVNSGEILLIFGSHYIADSIYRYFGFSFEDGVI